MLSVAEKICEKHYSFKDLSSCERCPISNECRSGCGAGKEALIAWKNKVESAAILSKDDHEGL